MKKTLYLLLIIINIIVLINCKKQEVNVNTVSSPNDLIMGNEIVVEQIPSLNDSTIEKETVMKTVPSLYSYITEDDILDNKEEVEKIENIPILFLLNEHYGYLNSELEVIVPPIYDRGYNYTDQGYTWIRQTKNRREFTCMILDAEGKIVFQENTASMEILYDDIITYDSRGDLHFIIVKFRDNIVIADKLGQQAIYSDDGVILIRNFHGSEWIFIDLNGNKIFSDMTLHRNTNGFREGRAVIIEGKDRKIKILSINGNIYSSLNFYRTNWYFYEGLLAAQTTDGRTGYINRNGEFAFLVPIIAYEPDHEDSPLNATNFVNGYALIQTVKKPSVWRVINNTGRYVSDELSILMAEAFVDGLSCAQTNDRKYGYINTSGEFVIEPIFDQADSFHRGYARIIYQGRDGLINTDGKIFWSDEFLETAN